MDNDHSLLETVSLPKKKNTPKGGFSGETDQHWTSRTSNQ